VRFMLDFGMIKVSFLPPLMSVLSATYILSYSHGPT